ncbi:lipoprotein [Spiroplasma endosymbiont of Polydrusus pterygomalis]|uniref:lipoprotein n=1 Tax=Spiroplasma endosymbiont of Polydrusus pterygomalis TaxID=3139327 RepID=UPI003CCA7F19
MKKILSILGAISLITSESSNLIGCDNKKTENNKSDPTFKPEQPLETSNWSLIDENNWENEFKEKNNKWYFLIKTLKIAGSAIFKEKYDQKNKIVISNIDNYKIIQFGNMAIQQFKNRPRVFVIYRWDSVDEPETPKIDNITGKIVDWK